MFISEVIHNILEIAGTTRKPVGMSNKEFAKIYAQTYVSIRMPKRRRKYEGSFK